MVVPPFLQYKHLTQRWQQATPKETLFNNFLSRNQTGREITARLLREYCPLASRMAMDLFEDKWLWTLNNLYLSQESSQP